MKSFTPEETIKVLKAMLDIDQRLKGIDYLKNLSKNISDTFQNKFVIIGHGVEPLKQKIQTDVVWDGNCYHDNFIYDLNGTPCENVLSGNRVCVYPDNVTQQFPKDTLLVDMGIESYIGSPMITAERKLAGILVLLDDNPIEDVDFYTAIVDFLAIRISTELERCYLEEELKRQVIIRTAELEEVNCKLKESLSEIKTLRGILPVCSYCKNIRDDKGYWNQIESYISDHSEAEFSHGICPNCIKKHYPEVAEAIKSKKESS